MPTLEEQIQHSIHDAMKNGRKVELEVLRTLMAEAKNAAIRGGLARTGLSDEIMITVLRRSVKQRREAEELARQASRADVAGREKSRGEILQRFLPQQAPQEEIEKVVEAVISELGAADRKSMGAVIKEALARLGGRADGRNVSRIAGTRLS